LTVIRRQVFKTYINIAEVINIDFTYTARNIRVVGPGSTCRSAPSRFFSHFIFILKVKGKKIKTQYPNLGNSLKLQKGIFINIIACKIRNGQQIYGDSVTCFVEGGVIIKWNLRKIVVPQTIFTESVND